jgi:hypothetical protein
MKQLVPVRSRESARLLDKAKPMPPSIAVSGQAFRYLRHNVLLFGGHTAAQPASNTTPTVIW